MNFQSGETLKNITITILDDSYVEETEYFILKIESMEGDVTFSVSETIVAVQDDDGKKLVAFQIVIQSLKSDYGMRVCITVL